MEVVTRVHEERSKQLDDRVFDHRQESHESETCIMSKIMYQVLGVVRCDGSQALCQKSSFRALSFVFCIDVTLSLAVSTLSCGG
eukprot:1993985-Amphidinium_carterae.1